MRRGESSRLAFLFAVSFACLAALAMVLGAVGCADSETGKVHLLVKVPRTGHDVVFDDDISYADQVIRIMAEEFQKTPEGKNVDIEIEVFEQNQYDAAVAGGCGRFSGRPRRPAPAASCGRLSYRTPSRRPRRTA